MRTENLYNFFFHPLSSQHSKGVKVLAVSTVIALSILTGGIFAAAFGIIQLKDRKIV
jgi:hypothetical protein